MIYQAHYNSPLGGILLSSDEEGLTGLWFDGEKYYPTEEKMEKMREEENPILSETKRWLDIYFSGVNPSFLPPLHPIGSTFRKYVWDILLEIPYGETVTYGSIAKKLEKELGYKKMSSQAVGGAVGHNEISIIIPCHRVVGANGNLIGYAGGIDKKKRLLDLEHVDLSKVTSLFTKH